MSEQIETQGAPERRLVPVEQPSPVLALFQQALDRGSDGANAMETLYKLYTAEREHTARLGFARALAAFQAECPAVERTSVAEIATASGIKFGYKYAEFDEVVRTVGPPLQRNGLSFSFDTEMNADRMTVACVLRHVDGHAERSTFSLPTTNKSAMSIQQAAGAALSFGKRNALVAILGLALTDPDPDGAADPSTITEAQAANLRAMIEETGAKLPKVLAYAGAESIEAIRASDFARVVAALEGWKRGAKS